MARQLPPSATSVAALQAGAVPSPVELSKGVAGQAGSRDALAQLTAAMSELREMAVQPILQRAVASLQADDFRAGGDWAIKALQQDERSGFGWYLLGIARERAGDFASSLQAYEAALKLLPDHAEIANDLGRLAYRLGMPPQAEKLFKHFLARHPDSAEAANNLACAIREQGRSEEAIEILRAAIEKNPQIAMLWNSMGTVVAEQGDYPTADIFFSEALKLDPAFPKARYNHGNALLAQGDAAGALAECDEALRGIIGEDDRQMMRLARSTILIALGCIGLGWDEYEARLSHQFTGVTHFSVDRPQWSPGDDISGKSLLVIGEQGLGDEMLFANVLSDVLEALGPDGALTIAVETRLVGFFQRSFPTARVGAHATYVVQGRLVRVVPFVEDLETVDLWTPMGSLMRQFRRDLESFPDRQGYLTADPERVAHWREVLKNAPAGPKVGLLWKSAVSRDARHRYFSPFEHWAPVLAQKGVTFVNLQYGDCAAELAQARDDLGVEIWTPPGIDLKQDLDDVAALCCAMDLVVGFSNATFNIAAACGVPAWLISTPGAWPRLGCEDRYPWYPQVRVWAPETFGDWATPMAAVAAELSVFAKASEH